MFFCGLPGLLNDSLILSGKHPFRLYFFIPKQGCKHMSTNWKYLEMENFDKSMCECGRNMIKQGV